MNSCCSEAQSGAPAETGQEDDEDEEQPVAPSEKPAAAGEDIDFKFSQSLVTVQSAEEESYLKGIDEYLKSFL